MCWEIQFDQSTCNLLVMLSSCIIWRGCRIMVDTTVADVTKLWSTLENAQNVASR